MAKSTKLHELLAVEGSLENQATKCRTDLIDTFNKKRHLFEEKRLVFQPNTEGAPAVTETQSDLQTTVQSELKWLESILVKSLDASYQVAVTNTRAAADIMLEDGTLLISGVPATALLELEKRIADVKLLIEAIPTLDPAKGFSLDTTREAGIYKAREIVKTRTRKTKVVMVLYKDTKEHPAQTQLVDEDVPVGKINEQEWSALMTPLTKSEYLNRVEILARAVRQARARANEAEVNLNAKIGEVLLTYVFGANATRPAVHEEGTAKK